MVALPPVPPVVGWRLATRLPRDNYVRLDANDYSVHPCAVGRRVEVRADLQQVTVSCDGRMVAAHQRCWAAHQTITDPAHRQAAAALRTRARQAPVSKVATDVQHCRLADYDRAFGLDDTQAVG
jgi:hypothetical protein